MGRTPRPLHDPGSIASLTNDTLIGRRRGDLAGPLQAGHHNHHTATPPTGRD